MTPKQAKREMLKSRHTRAIPKDGVSKGWYYIEPKGLCVLGTPTREASASMVLLTWKQVERALEIKRTAVGNDGGR